MRKRRNDGGIYRIPVEEFSPRQWAEQATFCVMGAGVAPDSAANENLRATVQRSSTGDWQAAALLALKEWKPVEGPQSLGAVKAKAAVLEILKDTGLLVLKERRTAMSTGLTDEQLEAALAAEKAAAAVLGALEALKKALEQDALEESIKEGAKAWLREQLGL